MRYSLWPQQLKRRAPSGGLGPHSNRRSRRNDSTKPLKGEPRRSTARGNKYHKSLSSLQALLFQRLGLIVGLCRIAQDHPESELAFLCAPPQDLILRAP